MLFIILIFKILMVKVKDALNATFVAFVAFIYASGNLCCLVGFFPGLVGLQWLDNADSPQTYMSADFSYPKVI